MTHSAPPAPLVAPAGHPPEPGNELAWLMLHACEWMSTRDVERVVESALRCLLQLSGAQSAYFFEVDSGKTHGIPKCGLDAQGQVIKNCDTKTQALVSKAVEQRRHFIATDESGSVDPSSMGLPGAGGPLRLRLLVVLPLTCGDNVIGALYADGKTLQEPPPPTQAIELLGKVVAAALENARLFERATNDLLTGLPNNTSFFFHLENALRDPLPQRVGGVLLLDLDDFKQVNLASNAEAGDQAMADVAATLRDVLRSDGFVSRYGSDKFAVLLPHDDAHPIAVRLHDVAERARAAMGTKQFSGIKLSACIGATGFAADAGHSAQDIVARADNALAAARQRGKGQIEVVPTLTRS